MTELEIAKQSFQLAKEIFEHFAGESLTFAKKIIHLEKELQECEKQSDKPSLTQPSRMTPQETKTETFSTANISTTSEEIDPIDLALSSPNDIPSKDPFPLIPKAPEDDLPF